MRLLTASIASGIAITVASASDLPLAAQPLTREQVVADLEFLRDQWAPLDAALANLRRRAAGSTEAAGSR